MVKKRRCNRCNELYDITNFDIANSKTGHYRRECKLCRSDKNKEYYKNKIEDIEEMKENAKIYEEVFGEKLT